MKEKKVLRKKFEAKGLSAEIKLEGVVEEDVAHLFNVLVREVNRFMQEEVMQRRAREMLSQKRPENFLDEMMKEDMDNLSKLTIK